MTLIPAGLVRHDWTLEIWVLTAAVKVGSRAKRERVFIVPMLNRCL